MVLQRGEATPIWGTAKPGEDVIVCVADVEARVKTGPDGKWRTTLNLAKAKEGPFTMSVEGEKNHEIQDVVIGEVWMCSGQSNMAFSLRSAMGAEDDIKKASESRVRQFQVGGAASPTPNEKCVGSWKVASPSTAGDFTAVGFYFGRDIAKELNRPVGLVFAAVGGTPIEAWTSDEAISTQPDLKASADAKREAWLSGYPKELDNYLTKLRDWQARYHRLDQPVENLADFISGDTSDWKEVKLPGKFADQGLPGSGSVWLRTTVDVPFESKPDSYRALDIALPSGAYEVYWNGKKLGGVPDEKAIVAFGGAMRRHVLAPEAVLKGKNEVAVRMFHPAGNLSVGGGADRLALVYRDGIKEGKVPLAGTWKVKIERELPPLDETAKKEVPPIPGPPPNPAWVASSLFNGYINTMAGYGIAGFLWYQGENNAERAYQYRFALPLLIQDWRKHWGNGDLPFYFAQLPNFGSRPGQPSDSKWAELRESQTFALKLPHTGMAVLIDAGEMRDIHPRDKRIVGDRLAAAVLAGTYGFKTPGGGPVFDKMSIEGDSLRLQFRNIKGGLVASPLPETVVEKTLPLTTAPLVRFSPKSELEGFAICAADRKWHWADAKIDGNSVVLRSPDVTAPVAARYAWADTSICNLADQAGFPAAPFRTDDFPLSTKDKKY